MLEEKKSFQTCRQGEALSKPNSKSGSKTNQKKTTKKKESERLNLTSLKTTSVQKTVLFLKKPNFTNQNRPVLYQPLQQVKKKKKFFLIIMKERCSKPLC